MTEEIYDIERELKNYEAQLLESARNYKRESLEAASARADLELARSRENIALTAEETARLAKLEDDKAKKAVKITVDQREALIDARTAEQLFKCRMAEAKTEGGKEELRALQACLSSVQTRARLLVTENNLTNYKP